MTEEAPIEAPVPTPAETQAQAAAETTNETQAPTAETPPMQPPVQTTTKTAAETTNESPAETQPPIQSQDDKPKLRHDVTPTHKLSKHNQYENSINLDHLASDIKDASNRLSAYDGDDLLCPIHKITESQKYANVINEQALTDNKAINRKHFTIDPNTDRKHFPVVPSTAQGPEHTCLNPFITGLIAGASIVAAFALGLAFGARFK